MYSIRINVAVTGVYGAAIASTTSDNTVPGNEAKSCLEVEALRDAAHDRIRQAKREIDEQFDSLVAGARNKTKETI